MRKLFLAIPISENLKIALENEFKKNTSILTLKGAKWMESQDWNIPTHFLGDCPEHLIPELIELSRGASGRMSSFTLKARNLQTFPHRGEAKMLELSFDRNLDFETLVNAQVELLSPFLKNEDKPNTSHAYLSLAKLKNSSEYRLQQKMGHLPLLEVNEVCLMESTPTTSGPVYSCLERFPLGS